MVTGLGLGITSSAHQFAVAGRDAITVTAYGDAQLDTAVKKYGTASLQFDNGANDYATFNLGADISGAFCVEGWMYFQQLPASASPGYTMMIGQGARYFMVQNTACFLGIQFGGSTKYYGWDLGTTVTLNTWHHLAWVRQSNGDMEFYYDGSAGTANAAYGNDSDFNDTNTWTNADGDMNIGRFNDSRGSMYGYMDEIRISNVARYSGSFTPSGPFTNDSDTLMLLHMDGSNGSTTITDDNG